MAGVQLNSFAEYQECALRTSKFKNLVYDPSSSYTADPSRVAVACMGLAGELGEIAGLLHDDDNFESWLSLNDEAGDFLYYIAELASACGILLDYKYFSGCYGITPRLYQNTIAIKYLASKTGQLIDGLKKYIGHGRSFDQEIVRIGLHRIMDMLRLLIYPLGMSLQNLAERNIEKLAARHGQDYSQDYYTNNKQEQIDE